MKPVDPHSHRAETPRPGRALGAALLSAVIAAAGCGTTQQSLATQQLLESDAIDAAVAQVDFGPLSGHKVFFDTAYLQDYKGIGFVNSNYVISGLRQQMLAAGCLLQEQKDDAEYIIEGRLGTLGSDQHDVVYGLPKNNALNTVASAVPNTPAMPAIPELALAKKVSSQGAAKLALFAFDRESRSPVWQSGLSIARSSARDTWILGAGPFQDGSIYRDRVRFAGGRFSLRFWRKQDDIQRGSRFTAYENGAVFHHDRLDEPARLADSIDAKPIDVTEEPEIQQVSATEVVEAEPEQESPPEAPAAPPAVDDEPRPFPDPATSAPAAP